MTEHAVAAYIAAGSSIAPRKHLAAALSMLRDRVAVAAVSTVYETPAIDRPDDPPFLNCVFQIETAASPRAVKFQFLREIEDRIGRQRQPDKYAPRTIDLDLVLHGNAVIRAPDLILPHPDLSRWFVRAALLELAPDIAIPGRRQRLRDLHAARGEAEGGTPVPDLTESLRRSLQQ